jgi:DNA-binding PadR family transcriptional regulator
MEFNKDKVYSMTLALLYRVTTNDKYGYRAWKGFDWDTMDRLYEKGYISNPKGKTKSVALTEEGERLSAQLFKEYFEVPTS